MEVLYNLSTNITKNTYTSSTVISATTSTIPRCIIPAMYFSVPGKTIRFTARGTIQAATVSFTFGIGLDATAGLGATVNGLFVQTNSLTIKNLLLPWDMEGDITAQVVGSGTTTLQLNAAVRVCDTNSAVWTPSTQLAQISTNTVGYDEEKQAYLEIWGAWQASAAGNTHTLQHFKVYGEN